LKLGVLFSGGKDSTFAAYLAKKQGHSLSCLLSVRPETDESYMFHFPNIRMTSLQAEAMRIPRIETATKGSKEEELTDLRLIIEEAKATYGIEGLCSGAIASGYQKGRIDSLCKEVGLVGFAPLWRIDQEKYLHMIIRNSFDVIVVGVSALGLDESWLGKHLNSQTVQDLIFRSRKFGFNAALEGGEGETFVLDCPLFASKIVIDETMKIWRGNSGYLLITKAHLSSKEPSHE
jgi:diphthine-ammonia ligase